MRLSMIMALSAGSLLWALHASADGEPYLLAWASLPQQKRTRGPTSGQFIRAALGVTPPFIDAQPVPGWSGLVCNADGSFVAMPDNGFGAKGNSADYVTGFYLVKSKLKTRADGSLEPGIAVDPRITRERLLTGYDFEVESIARAADGSYWVGEEFGPFLLHLRRAR